jgi:hypothetical protein
VEPTVRDTAPPAIEIASPSATTYTLGAVVTAAYACADADSAVISCAGPVPSGTPLDTSAVGPKTFTVTAADAEGNTASSTVPWSVAYGVCVLHDTAHAKKAGSTIPIRIQLCDAQGRNVSSLSVGVAAVAIRKVDETAAAEAEDAGQANPDDGFRFDPSLGGSGGYVFNLKTTGLTTGTYVIAWTATGDPAIHDGDVTFRVR